MIVKTSNHMSNTVNGNCPVPVFKDDIECSKCINFLTTLSTLHLYASCCC